jgi:type I restriction enzyme S subunit
MKIRARTGPPVKVKGTWPTVLIGDSLDLINGRAFKPTEWTKDGTPIVRIQNLNNPDASFNYFQGDLPAKFLLADGDLLFAWSGTPGTSFGAHIWRGGKAWLNQHIFKVQFDDKQFDKKFLQLAINQNLTQYIRAAHGAAGLAHITKGRFEESELPQPSLPEQQRVVGEIETQFTRLEAGVAALRRVQANLKRYRGAVLKAACEGRLVPNEADLIKAPRKQSTFETGQELLARILTERRRNWQGRGKYQEPTTPDTKALPGLPKGWTYVSVEAVGFVQLGRQRAPKHHKGANMRPYLRVANIFEDRIDLSDVKEMNFTPAEFQVYRLQRNDILLNEGQSLELVGRPAIYRDELPGSCFTNTLVRFRPCPSLQVKFAQSVFRAFMHSGRFQQIARWTTNIAHLGADRFAKLAFPLPPLAEQTRIVAEVERRLSVVEELESVVTANLQRATRLRQSILQKAFTGNLI